MLPTSYNYVNSILMIVKWNFSKEKVKQHFSEFQRYLCIECGEKRGTVDKITEDDEEKEGEEEEELYHVLIKHHLKR